MKLGFYSAFVAAFFFLPTAFAESDISEEESYRVPVYEGVKFEAKLTDEGTVYMNWNAFEERDNQEFMYYKVLRSYGNSNPLYPEDGAIGVKTGLGDTRHTDAGAQKSAYYRVCVITKVKGRYCSNVVWIERGDDNRQELHNNMTAEKPERKEKHEAHWKETQESKPVFDDKNRADKIKEKTHSIKNRIMEKKVAGKNEAQKRMKPEDTTENKDMEGRMEKAFEKAKPKIDKFLDRVETALIDSEKLSSEQKIKKIKQLQERFYAWKKGNAFKIMVVEYLDESFNKWIDELSNDFEVDDIDSMLDGLFDQ